MNISLPIPLKTWVEEQVETRGYSTASEFVRDVLRREQEQSTLAAVDAKLLKAIKSGKSTPMTADDWQKIRTEGSKRAKKGRNPTSPRTNGRGKK